MSRELMSNRVIIMYITPYTLVHYAICIIWPPHSLPSWGSMESDALLKLCNTTLCIITYSTVVLIGKRE